ncbi:MAG: ABC transporter ATP-binding protein [Victivallales bacterium]|nr:ABC transporter ATP-binding protein [Victivallales bacterium]
MAKKHEQQEEFRRQSYWRLLKYAGPYKYKLMIGILAGFVVGGSLFGSLMIIPDLMTAVDGSGGGVKKEDVRAEKIVQTLSDDPDAPPETRLNAVRKILDPHYGEKDPKLVELLNKVEHYSKKLHLPLTVKSDSMEWNFLVHFTMPVMNASRRMSWELFGIYLLAFVIGWTLKNLATYVNRYYTRWVGTKVIADLRDQVFDRLVNQSIKFYGKMDVGQLISRCTNDTAAIESSVANTIADAARCPLEIMACIGAIVIASWKYHNYALLAILFIGLPLSVLPIILLSRAIRRVYKSSFKKIADVTTRMHEVFTGIKIVKAYNTEKEEMQRFSGVNRRYVRTVVHALKLQLLMAPLMEVVAVTSTLLFLLYSYSRAVTLTELAALLAPAFMAYRPIKELAKVSTYLQRSMAAADRYFALLDMDNELKENPDAVGLQSFEKEISVNDVVFHYKEGHNVVDHVSFKIKKGQVVAIVGESGSGKTTIANLIARFYDVSAGSVTIDGIDLRDLTIASLRRNIGVVNQEAILFNDTVAHNIAYGCPEASREQIVAAAKLANAHDFIVGGGHTEGYDSLVGEKGCNLSGGERQRVAIARAILRNPPILILDEATSALDTVTERQVQEALNRVMANRTVFAIAHRLSTIKHADIILVMDKSGKIAERGTHDELLRIPDGKYCKLYNSLI